MRRAAMLLAVVATACHSSSASPGNDQADACAIPSLLDEYPGDGLPAPYGPLAAAPACVTAPHDAIVVLGCPNEDDGGAPSDCQIARADLAVAAMKAGWGSRFITSGAAAHNQWVEADTLADLLVARGVPAESIFRDRQALHTDENLYYSSRIMQDHGWKTALVVSDSPSHLVMAATCDADCCVKLGRLTVFDFPMDGGTVKIGHYELYPGPPEVTQAECDHITTKLMCIALPGRLSCRDHFLLDAGGE